MTILSNNKKTQQQSVAQQVTSATTSTTSNPVLIPTPLVVNNSLDSSLVDQSNPTSVDTENIKTESKSALIGLAENANNSAVAINTGQSETTGVDQVKSSSKASSLSNASSGGDDAKTVNIQISDIQTVSFNFSLLFNICLCVVVV